MGVDRSSLFTIHVSFIGNKYLITTKDFKRSSAVVYAGSIRRRSGEAINVNMTMLFPHGIYINPSIAYPTEPNVSEYKLNATKQRYDIALVKLEKEFTRHSNDRTHYLINTVCLPNAGELNESKENATVAGFGSIDTKNTNPKALQIAEIILNPSKHCLIASTLCTTRFDSDDLANIGRPCHVMTIKYIIEN